MMNKYRAVLVLRLEWAAPLNSMARQSAAESGLQSIGGEL